jgi:uncharacterized membrane protein
VGRGIDGRAGWRPPVTLTLCLVGLSLSAYTMWVHVHHALAACVDAGPVDCQAVLTSAQSIIFGVPLPAFGLLFFVGMGVLCLPMAWRTSLAWVHLLRLAGVIVGIGSVIYLVATELFTIRKICLWCSGVHLITLALFIIVVTSTPVLLVRSTTFHATTEARAP